MRSIMNHKGMSILELIISIAISTIVILMIVAFLNGAFRTFRRANDEVNLQMEAQTTINQITNLVMEAKSISPKNIILTDDERYLIDLQDGSNDYTIIFRKDINKLYLKELTGAEVYQTATYDDKVNLLTEYVDEFDISSVNGDSSVKNIKLKLFLGVDDFSITKKVNLRNMQ